MLRGRTPTDGAFTSWNNALQGAGSSAPANTMKIVIQSAMVFLGTLLAAALVALGEPAQAEVQMVVQTPPAEMVVGLLGLSD
jgi:hypothetical protein